MNFYIVTHVHEYGADSHLVVSEETPSEKQVVRELELDFEPSKSETLEITPLADQEYRNPKVLSRLEGDDEDFDEFAEDRPS